MHQFYTKNKLAFAISWIIIYVVSLSFADSLSESIGIYKSITALFAIVLSLIIIHWIIKNQLTREMGLCKSEIIPSKLLYYFPLVILASVNLWKGFSVQHSLLEVLFHLISMFFVGFLEEIIFRGLLFQAMKNDGLKTAVLVSSLTFGIGHIVNLFNGSSAELLATMLQIIYASSAGLLFTLLFIKTKSLWACIICHGTLNALSIFANTAVITPEFEIFTAIMLTSISLLYTGYIAKR